jgi:DNA anti-recombination protein RmuC
MTFVEQLMLVGAIVNAAGLFAVIVGQLRGGAANIAAQATSNTAQFAALDKACSASIAALRNELLARIDNQSANMGQVTQNIGNRIHGVELEAAKTRADAAENMLKVISTLREEFRRDVREETTELRQEMQQSFNRLEAVVDNMAASLARGMLGLAAHTGD